MRVAGTQLDIQYIGCVFSTCNQQRLNEPTSEKLYNSLLCGKRISLLVFHLARRAFLSVQNHHNGEKVLLTNQSCAMPVAHVFCESNLLFSPM